MNRRSFFTSLGAIVAAAAAPGLFLPKFEPVQWKVLPVHCSFTQFIIDQTPLFDEWIIDQIKPCDGWVRVDSYPEFSSQSLIQYERPMLADSGH